MRVSRTPHSGLCARPAALQLQGLASGFLPAILRAPFRVRGKMKRPGLYKQLHLLTSNSIFTSHCIFSQATASSPATASSHKTASYSYKQQPLTRTGCTPIDALPQYLNLPFWRTVACGPERLDVGAQRARTVRPARLCRRSGRSGIAVSRVRGCGPRRRCPRALEVFL
jgi:hypothetical protein